MEFNSTKSCNNYTCNCEEKFKESKLLEFNKQFNDMTPHEQKNFILNSVIRTKSENSYKFECFLKLNKVCPKFFLKTLGYNNWNVIYNLSKSIDKLDLEWNDLINSPIDFRKCNKFLKRDNVFKNLICEYIEPKAQFSHYKRENCPNKRYLENTNSIESYIDFAKEFNLVPIYNNIEVDNESENKCCTYSYFCRILKYLNIGFSNPCYSGCKLCFKYKEHQRQNSSSKICDNNCEICEMFELHIKEVKLVRNLVREDTELQNLSKVENNVYPKILVVSADTQKVLQIPKLPIKDAYFSERIGVTNFTIAQFGKNSKGICFLSHEAEIDRKASDFCNYFYKFFLSEMCKNAEEVVIKLDNCFQQNKNKTLLSNLTIIVNEPEFRPNSITLDYLKTGHTYQPADNIHSIIEKKIKKEQIIYDFDNLLEIIKYKNNSAKIIDDRIEVIPVHYCDIYKFNNNFINKKDFDLRDIKSIQFRKGKENVFIKFDYITEFKEFNILNKKTLKSLKNNINLVKSGKNVSMIRTFPKCKSAIGISKDKKASILKSIDCIENKFKYFYQNLYVNNKRKHYEVL
jgi:hypothetical protein